MGRNNYQLRPPKYCAYCGHDFHGETYWSRGTQQIRVPLDAVLTHMRREHRHEFPRPPAHA